MLNAPITLNDIWKIEGKLATGVNASSEPLIPGDEGVGIVEEPGNSNFKRGDWVIPARSGLGTWRSFISAKSSDLIKIRNDIQPEIASCLFVSPVTAKRVLEDFVQLKEGDVVIQNGGSGLVGQTVVQLAHMMGVKVISVMRQRGEEEYGYIVERTKKDGAYIAIADDQIHTPRFRDLISDLPEPKLAIDCSGGSSATNIARLLGEGGTMVSISNASRDPVLLPTGMFISKDIKLKTFNFENWLGKTTEEERDGLVHDFSALVAQKKLKLWVEAFEMWDYRTPLTEMTLRWDRKPVFTLHNDPELE
mmetsp:Transcript_22293/g.28459  ORF Transcript_22293/g.28459 Transcript_22293/m.28459 type:complete len:306 (+) Transcript_22293:214-1131(+)